MNPTLCVWRHKGGPAGDGAHVTKMRNAFSFKQLIETTCVWHSP